MTNLICITFLSLIFISDIYAQVSVVEVEKSEAPVYKNQKRELYEKALYTAQPGEQLKLIKEEKEYIKIRTKTGVEGWVEKRLVNPVKATETKGTGVTQGAAKGKGATYVMDKLAVQGYLDNPQAVYILDMTDPSFKPIKLDRSFSDEIPENIDKETMQRQCDPMLKPTK